MIDDVTAKTSEAADSDVVVSSYLTHSFMENGPETVQFNAQQEPDRDYRVPARGNPNTGTPFEIKKTGRVVQKLQIWSFFKYLRGVQITFDDGAVMKAGSLDGDSRSITLHGDEYITSTGISSADFDGGRAGNVSFATSFGQTFLGVFPSKSGWPMNNKFTLYTDNTKGSLIGLYGSAGSDINSLGVLLAPPEDVEVEYTNVKYDLTEAISVANRPINMKVGSIQNPSDGTITKTLTFSHQYGTVNTWSNSAGVKVGIKARLKAGVPLIVDESIELSAEVSYTFTYGSAVTDLKTDTWSVQIQAPPRTAMGLMAVITEETLQVPYTSDLLIRSVDGSSRTLNNVAGIYRGVNVSSMVTKSVKLPLEQSSSADIFDSNYAAESSL